MVERLKTFELVDQLADVDTVLLDTLTVDLHNLLAYITFVGAVGGLIAFVVVAVAGHLLHLAIHWFLSVDLRTKAMHTLTHTFHNLH